MHFEQTPSPIEHYVTLFDRNFLPMGLCLHESLTQHAGPFHLWIVCMDGLVYRQLTLLKLNHVTLIPLLEIEDERLKEVKPGRSPGEYCWTITPFSPDAVFGLDPEVQRVTYLDADLFFFRSPKPFFEEFERSGKHVLITEHAYAPEYAYRAAESGRFCVQFMTFRRTTEARVIMKWWQDRCVEWCFARSEEGKFGDQKYLDVWPEVFLQQVHILTQTKSTLAPWNVRYVLQDSGQPEFPIIYHFHALRIISNCEIKLYDGYKVGKSALAFYNEYINVLKVKISIMATYGIPVPVIPEKNQILSWLKNLKKKLFRIADYTKLIA